MTVVQTKDLTGRALDYAAALAEGKSNDSNHSASLMPQPGGCDHD